MKTNTKILIAVILLVAVVKIWTSVIVYGECRQSNSMFYCMKVAG